MLRRITFLATCAAWLCLTTVNAQTTYPVNWVKFKNAEVVNNTLQHTAGAQNKGVGTSRQLLYGEGESNTFEGYLEYTAGNNTDLKKIGYVVVDAPEVESGAISYGFSFLKNGKVRAQTPFGSSAKINYSAGDVFRIDRQVNLIKFTINSAVVYSIQVDPTEHLLIRGDLKSLGSTFAEVVCSFNTTPFCVIPEIDNVNNKIRLAISGAYPPYRYVWESGAVIIDTDSRTDPGTAPGFDCFLDGNYRVTILDAQKNAIERMFSVGEDVNWTNFFESQVTDDVLEKISGNGWGAATHNNSFDPTSVAWVEYIIEEASGKKAFGFSDASANVRKPRHLKAGYLINKDNLQVIVDGAVVLTEDYADKDALNISYNAGLVTWFKNGVEFYSATYTANGDVDIIGLVRGNGTLKHLSYDINPETIYTTTFDETAGTGSITVDISSATTAQGPFHYIISEEMMPDLGDIYQQLKDTIPVPIDSLSFFTGYYNSTTHTFSGYDAGRYFVTVFDSQGNRVFGKKIQLQGPLQFDVQSGLVASGTSITATNDPSYGSLQLYTADNVDGIFEIELSRVNGQRQQFAGLAGPEVVVDDYQDLEYGFYLEGRRLYTVQNGVVSTEFFRLRDARSITFELESGILRISAAGREVLNTALPATYAYKIGLGTVPGATMKLNVVKGFGLKAIPAITINTTPGSCFSSNGTIEVAYNTGAFSSFIQVNPPTLFDVAANTSTVMPLVDPGLYGISNLIPGTYVINSNLVVSFTIGGITISFPLPVPPQVVQIHSRLDWTNLIETEYAPLSNFPQNESITRNSNASGDFLGSAQANHLLSSLTENALFFRLNLPNTIDIGILRWTDQVDAAGSVYSGIAQEPFEGVAFIRGAFGVYVGKFANGAIQGPFATVSNPSGSFAYYYNTNGQARLDEFNTSGNASTLIPPYNVGGTATHLMVNPLRVGTGFFDVLTNMPCIVPDIYAKVERKLRGVKYKAYENTLRFYVNEEYNASGSLNYRIYSAQDRVTPIQDGTQVVESVQYGDNRYVLPLTNVAQPGAYILEVENDKKEKFYLRFIK